MTRKPSTPLPRPAPPVATRLGALLPLLGLTLWGCGAGSDAHECAPPPAPAVAAAQARPSPEPTPTPPPVVVSDPGARAAAPIPASLQPPSPAATPAPRAAAAPPLAPAPAPAERAAPAPARLAQPAAAPPAAPLPRLQVDGDFGILEAATAASVDKRVPVGVSDAFDTNVGKVWAYVKVKNKGEPTQIVMVWKKDGVEKFRYDLRVGRSTGWRTWTRKRIGPRDAGAWTVEVLDAAGAELHTLAFDVAPAPQALAVDG